MKDISIIGFAENMRKSKLAFTARISLAEVGVPYDEIDEGKYPHWDETLVPCEAVVCEPVIISFIDGSTFEFQPVNGSSLKMSTNQLNGNMKNGLNLSNFNASKMFSEIKGAEIQAVYLRSITYNSASNGSYNYPEVRVKSIFQIHMTGDYGLMIYQWYNGLFSVALLQPTSYNKLRRIMESARKI
ncbi:MAG: hypothetical protein LRY67_06385 [Gammaproteobacteria bacterium]|nr:hypothetical protein [Gammaproteobacteria bacterium]